MAKLHEKILSIHFRRAAKRLVALALAVIVAGGSACTALLMPQINEAVVLVQTEAEQERALPETGTEQPAKKPTDGEHRRAEHFDWERLPLSEPSRSAKIAVCVTAGLLLALFAAYWLLCAAWLYRAAYLADMNRRLWLALGLLGNAAAAALFLLVRGALRTRCAQCGTWQHRGHFCANCGNELIHYCPSCGTAISAKDLFCKRCGKRVVGEVKGSVGV